MADDRPLSERTEQPTERRLREAREHGRVARSRELETTAVLLAASLTLLAAAPAIVGWATGLMRDGLSFDARALEDGGLIGSVLRREVFTGLTLVIAVSVPSMIAAILAPLVVGGLVYSGKALVPDFSRLDPVAGLSRIFGLHGLMELAKALAKFAAVGAVAVALLLELAPRIIALGGQEVASGVSHGAWMLLVCLLVLSVSLGAIALADVPFQRWNHSRNLRMTREEVREDLKESEGRPEVRSRLRQIAQDRARRRMMQEVPQADVVIVNPTHYAIALRYLTTGRAGAPRVVAKGRELVAARIRQLAQEHGVPIFESPPLARALYLATDLGEEIPAGLYTAVAKVLTWVYRTHAAERAGTAAPPPPMLLAEEVGMGRER